jgi:hypothetical protein
MRTIGPNARRCGADGGAVDHWTAGEVDEAAFRDARLGRRFGELLKQMADGLGDSILSAVKFWTRKKFRGTAALKRKINPTRVPIEKKESVRWLDNLRASIERLGDAERCVHVGDRESDIYELYCLTRKLGAHFVVRACVDRLAGDGGHTIADEMEEARVKGLHHVGLRDEKGETTRIALEIRFKRITVLPPIGKRKRYPALDLSVIHAVERGAPRGRKPIEWRLITDFPIRDRTEAIEKINWYAMRWKIEVFHKILKSGCKAEVSDANAGKQRRRAQ